MRKPLLLFTLSVFFASCVSGKYKPSEKIYKKKVNALAKQMSERPATSQLKTIPQSDKEWAASTNFSIRKPNFVVIHHTAQNSTAQTIKTFQLERTAVSSHYVIGRDGKVVQMVNDYLRAQHAGLGKWGSITDMNSSSIGIEMDNNGTTDSWPDVQINALVDLLKVISVRHQIPQANFLGHADYAPTRKNDPYRFPWKKLADNGFGYWYDTELIAPPVDFNPIMGLKVIGYDTRNLRDAIRSFKIHYIQENENFEGLNDFELRVLYNVSMKFLK